MPQVTAIDFTFAFLAACTSRISSPMKTIWFLGILYLLAMRFILHAFVNKDTFPVTVSKRFRRLCLSKNLKIFFLEFYEIIPKV